MYFLAVAVTGQAAITEYGVHKMIKIEHDVETGEIKEIELTPAEIKAKEADAAKTGEKIAVENAAHQAKAAEKAALLAKLGLTAEELAALLS